MIDLCLCILQLYDLPVDDVADLHPLQLQLLQLVFMTHSINLALSFSPSRIPTNLVKYFCAEARSIAMQTKST